MITKMRIGALHAGWLKWTAVPLLAFLAAGLVTKMLGPARDGEREQLGPTIVASLQKLEAGDRTGAVSGLARAGTMAPGNLGVQTGLIGKFEALGEHKLAAEAIERSLRAMPKERQAAGTYAGLCEYLLRHGDIKNSKRVLATDLLARWPDAFETAYIGGAVMLREASGRDDLVAAAQQLEACVALDAGHVRSKLQLGIAYLRLGELERAESLLRTVQAQQPSDPEVLDHLGEVLRQQGKAAEAAIVQVEHERVSELQARRRQLESLALLNQLEPVDSLALSRIYAQLEEFARAASTLRGYTRHKPEDADAQRELAGVCLKAGDVDGARVATELAEALDAAQKSPHPAPAPDRVADRAVDRAVGGEESKDR